MIRFLRRKWPPVLKLIGWGFLVVYLLRYRVHFEPAWVAVFLAIFVAGGVLYVFLVKPLLQKVLRRQFDEGEPESLYPNAKNMALVMGIRRNPLGEFLLLPGEVGFFLVPLMILGLSWLTAIIFGVLWGFVHFQNYSIVQCTVKAVLLTTAILIVLPHGLLTFVAGHLILDGVGFVALHLVGRDKEATSG
ncbi:MAG: hypothetical protein ACE5HM_06575 [Acidiferrobacterales bacterium]